ncbi:hypothetical protein J2X02_001602 [Pseudoxanthomonas japonensis]|uniref:hypothetical protein n=1 Tax=Pseudoxanthomonas japonensis TaxID=69284 RepID=UPI00285CD102|nr:hypothetical protein [Pseudoxanthomonas japonensis]MDR7068785.1 hypothetical protein [Pseudoxanthomonas japonensis]
MERWSKLRVWINRDDGRLYQVGNASIGSLSILGGLAIIASLVLSQLHRHADLHVAGRLPWGSSASCCGFSAAPAINVTMTSDRFGIDKHQ